MLLGCTTVEKHETNDGCDLVDVVYLPCPQCRRRLDFKLVVAPIPETPAKVEDRRRNRAGRVNRQLRCSQAGPSSQEPSTVGPGLVAVVTAPGATKLEDSPLRPFPILPFADLPQSASIIDLPMPRTPNAEALNLLDIEDTHKSAALPWETPPVSQKVEPVPIDVTADELIEPWTTVTPPRRRTTPLLQQTSLRTWLQAGLTKTMREGRAPYQLRRSIKAKLQAARDSILRQTPTFPPNHVTYPPSPGAPRTSVATARAKRGRLSMAKAI